MVKNGTLLKFSFSFLSLILILICFFCLVYVYICLFRLVLGFSYVFKHARLLDFTFLVVALSVLIRVSG